jgi:DNA polymerase III alpha subunit
MTIPLFKTHYSIGKSILTLHPPSRVEEGGSDSAIDIALDSGLDTLVLVEDSMHGFLEAKRRCEENNLQLIFGIRINMCQEYEVEKDKVPSHKVVVFAKNDKGAQRLYKIYSEVFAIMRVKLRSLILKNTGTKKS